MAIGGGSGGGASSGGVRAGKAFVELGVKDSLTGALKGIESRFNRVGQTLAKVGAPLAGVGVSAAAGLSAATDQLAELDRLNSARKALGLSAEGGSGLFGALGQYSDLGENVEGLTQFAQKVQDAFAGVGEEPKKLFDGLSVSAQELIALPLDEKFYKIHEAIRELPQDQQQFKLSMLGGTDSMKKWLPLLSMSTDELRKQAAGFALSNDELATATEANTAYKSAVGSLNKVWQQVSIALAPVVETLADGFRELAEPVIAWVKENRAAVGVAVSAALAFGAVGTALVTAGAAFAGVAAAAGTVASVVGLAADGIGAVVGAVAAVGPEAAVAVAAVAALGTAFVTGTDTGAAWAAAVGGAIRSAFDAVAGYARETWNTVTTVWGGIKNAFAAGDLTLAFRIATAGLEVEWKRFLLLFQQGWNAVEGFLTDSWQDVKAEFKIAVLGMADGNVWVSLAGAAQAVADKVGGYFTDLLQGVKDRAKDVFTALWEAVKDPLAAKDKLTDWLAEKLDPIGPSVLKADELQAELEKAAEEFGAEIALQGEAGIRAAAEAAKAEARAARAAAEAEAEKAVGDAKARLDRLNLSAAIAAEQAAAKRAADDVAAAQGQQLAGIGKTMDFAFGGSGYLSQALGKGAANPMVGEQKTTNKLLEQIKDRIGANQLVFE